MTTSTTAGAAASLFHAIEASQRTFSGGHLVPSKDKENRRVLHASLVWKDRDLVSGTALLTSTQHVLANNAVVSGLPTSIPSQYVSYSPSSKWSVVITDIPDDKTSAQFAFYSRQRLLHVHRTPKDLHGGLYLGVSEGGICWSEDESFVYYLAEQKDPEGKPFWASANAAAAADPTKDTSSLIGRQFDHKEDWGEQYVGKRTSRIFTMDVQSGKCAEVLGIPTTLACSEVAVVPRTKTILFTAIDTTSRRLGLIYCFNRPKALYSLDVSPDGKATKLPIRVAANTRSARVSPDGTKIAFLGTADVVTHNTCNLLGIFDWATQQDRVVVPIVDEPTDASFHGLYMLSLLPHAWSFDSKLIYVNTEVGTRVLWKAIDVETGAVRSPEYALGDASGSETLVDVCETHALVAVSTPQTPAGIHWVQLKDGVQVVSRTPVDTQESSPHVESWSIESIVPSSAATRTLSLVAQAATPLLPDVTSDTPYDALVLWPRGAKVDGASVSSANGIPVVLDLHGGPHGHSPAAFRASYAYFCALGFAVVSVNYRGSVGYGRAPLESLVGKVGSQDVTDCHHAVLHVLSKYAGRLDATRVHVSGGSHGGFLGAHLIGQFPTFYKSAVLRNPVVNIASLFFTSDIPDWGCAVTGVAAFESIATNSAVSSSKGTHRTATMARFWELSPMSNDLAAIQTPVLLGLGGKDRRVPPTQGIQFFHSLQHHGRTARVQWYPDDCHPLDSVKAYGDFAVQWGLWLLEHNK